MTNSTRDRRDALPVMVVGAGPTGLAAAMDLARFGVSCRLIEKLPEPQTHSRAVAIQPRTPELFE
jgi:2-polyprenyl-6-methoxyphenol hydroxylase-like FAD-dependent oxidoreductase